MALPPARMPAGYSLIFKVSIHEYIDAAQGNIRVNISSAEPSQNFNYCFVTPFLSIHQLEPSANLTNTHVAVGVVASAVTTAD